MPSPDFLRRLISVAIVAGALVLQTACAPPTSITIDGRGWGHGRGMGQWGAYGYAVDDAWTGTRILQHFYRNTTSSKLTSNVQQRVYLTGSDGQDVILYNALGRLRSSVDNYASYYRALRIRYVDSTKFQVYGGSSCDGPWIAFPTLHVHSAIRVKPPTGSPVDTRSMIQRCRVGYTRYYRGDMLAMHARGSIIAINDVDTESVVRSVIAREISPSWADAGAGRGAAAVRAQAVATPCVNALASAP